MLYNLNKYGIFRPISNLEKVQGKDVLRVLRGKEYLQKSCR